MNAVDLSSFSSKGFQRGASIFKEFLWVLVRWTVFELNPFGFYRLKRWLLRLFGAGIGAGVVIKPNVKITFPWKLTVGDHVWLGEGCWLLNLDQTTIEHDVCVSQRAMLCTGSHDYKSKSFDLMVQPITVRSGAWVGADTWIGPGVTIGSHAVLSAGSVTNHDLEAYGVYRGNPAVKVRERTIG